MSLETVRAPRLRKRRRAAALALWLSLGVGLAGAESLWEPTFAGLIAGESVLRVGDLVTIEIDSAASFDFEATANDNKTLSLSLSGGDLGDLFSFLPSGSSGGDLATGGQQSYAIQALVGARVVDTDAGGNARVEGIRSVTLAGRQESVTVAGWLDPGALASGVGQRAMFSQLTDGVLSVTSFLAPEAPILRADDLVIPDLDVATAQDAINPLLAPAAAPDVDDLLAAAGQADAATVDGAAAAGQPKLALSDERQRELLLQYLNRLIDLIFQ